MLGYIEGEFNNGLKLLQFQNIEIRRNLRTTFHVYIFQRFDDSTHDVACKTVSSIYVERKEFGSPASILGLHIAVCSFVEE
jgi:hypothetical protein